jgi:hypothetical protein
MKDETPLSELYTHEYFLLFFSLFLHASIQVFYLVQRGHSLKMRFADTPHVMILQNTHFLHIS